MARKKLCYDNENWTRYGDQWHIFEEIYQGVWTMRLEGMRIRCMLCHGVVGSSDKDFCDDKRCRLIIDQYHMLLEMHGAVHVFIESHSDDIDVSRETEALILLALEPEIKARIAQHKCPADKDFGA